MKFIYKKQLVELILVFESNQVTAHCSSSNAAPKEVSGGKLVNYADLKSEHFMVSDLILGNGESFSFEEIIKNFSINEIIQRICRKIDEYAQNQY